VPTVLDNLAVEVMRRLDHAEKAGLNPWTIMELERGEWPGAAVPLRCAS